MAKFLLIAFSLIILISCNKSTKSQSDNVTIDFSKNSNIVINQCDSSTVEDLATLCKIWGFLKYYHPIVAKGKENWDYELFRITPLIINAKTREEKEKAYLDWIQQFGTIRQQEITSTIDSSEIKMFPDISWIEDSVELGKISKTLIKIKTAQRKNPNHYAHLNKNSLIPVPSLNNENSYSDLHFPDTGYRLLALFRYWNIIQYYYPYKYLIDENWNDVLLNFIPIFISARDRLEYEQALLKLICCIHDNHATTKPLSRYKDKRYIIPIYVDFVEGKAVVTRSYATDTTTMLKQGDIILNIEGKDIKEIISEEKEYISVSNERSLLVSVASNLLKSSKDRLLIKYERDGKLHSDIIIGSPIHDARIPPKTQLKKPLYEYLSAGKILYLYLGSDSGGIIPDNINTKGIIIDLRCYPNGQKVKGYWDFTQLYPVPTEFARFTSSSISTPGLFRFSPPIAVGKVNFGYYKGKIVILINELSQSHAEFMTMKYRCAPNAVVIGSATAGTDGDATHFSLPGGIHTTITGLGVYYPDKKETQRVGIIPDIEVKPTIKGIRENRDEVLEKAINLIKLI